MFSSRPYHSLGLGLSGATSVSPATLCPDVGGGASRLPIIGAGQVFHVLNLAIPVPSVGRLLPSLPFFQPLCDASVDRPTDAVSLRSETGRMVSKKLIRLLHSSLLYHSDHLIVNIADVWYTVVKSSPRTAWQVSITSGAGRRMEETLAAHIVETKARSFI